MLLKPILSQARIDSQKSSPPATPEEFAIVKLLCDAGFHHKRIAALFDCNQGRIAEINRGHIGGGIAYDFSVIGGEK